MSYQPTTAGPERRISPAGVIVVVVGIVLVAIALVALDWVSVGEFKLSFADIHDQASGLEGIDKAYFGWLAYVVAGATVLFAVLATIPQAAQMASKALAATLGTFGIIVSFVVFNRVNVDVGDRGIGFWLFVGGLAVLIAGAAIPSRPVVNYLPGYGMPDPAGSLRRAVRRRPAGAAVPVARLRRAAVDGPAERADDAGVRATAGGRLGAGSGSEHHAGRLGARSHRPQPVPLLGRPDVDGARVQRPGAGLGPDVIRRRRPLRPGCGRPPDQRTSGPT